jgi:hypothetical protein
MNSDEEEWDENKKCTYLDNAAFDSDGDDNDNELFEKVSVSELGFELNRDTRTRSVKKVKRKASANATNLVAKAVKLAVITSSSSAKSSAKVKNQKKENALVDDKLNGKRKAPEIETMKVSKAVKVDLPILEAVTTLAQTASLIAASLPALAVTASSSAASSATSTATSTATSSATSSAKVVKKKKKKKEKVLAYDQLDSDDDDDDDDDDDGDDVSDDGAIAALAKKEKKSRQFGGPLKDDDKLFEVQGTIVDVTLVNATVFLPVEFSSTIDSMTEGKHIASAASTWINMEQEQALRPIPDSAIALEKSRLNKRKKDVLKEAQSAVQKGITEWALNTSFDILLTEGEIRAQFKQYIDANAFLAAYYLHISAILACKIAIKRFFTCKSTNDDVFKVTKKGIESTQTRKVIRVDFRRKFYNKFIDKDFEKFIENTIILILKNNIILLGAFTFFFIFKLN